MAPQNNGIPDGPSSPSGESDALLAPTTEIECGTTARARPSRLLRVSSVNDFTTASTSRTQTTSCRDVCYGVLFLTQLVLVAVAGAGYRPDALANPDDNKHALLS